MLQSLVSRQLCHAQRMAIPDTSQLTATRMSNPFQAGHLESHIVINQHNLTVRVSGLARCWILQSFQCGKGTGQPQLRSPAGLGVGQGTTACPDSSNPISTSPAASSAGTAGTGECNTSVSSRPHLASPTPPVHAVAESSKLLSSPPQPTSTKRKRRSKVDDLPSLQDAPGVPERLGDQPLRLIIVGHNPSDHAW